MNTIPIDDNPKIIKFEEVNDDSKIMKSEEIEKIKNYMVNVVSFYDVRPKLYEYIKSKTVSANEHPTNEHPTNEHPTDEHPTDEHPTDEHPTDEHPTDEHPTDERSKTEMVIRYFMNMYKICIRNS